MTLLKKSHAFLFFCIHLCYDYLFLGLNAFWIFFPRMSFAQSRSTDAIQMLINLNAAYPALWQMVTGFCYIAGFCFIFRGIFYLKLYGELRTMQSTQTSLKIPLVFFMVGSVFIYLPTAYSIASTTVFGDSSVLKYDDISSTLSPEVLQAITGLISFVGLISFIKGWMILVAHAQQPGGQASLGKAITHIIGGLLAINVLNAAKIIWKTFGFNFGG